MLKVLFVCKGNICRSPLAEGLFRSYVEKLDILHHFYVDSAGTHAELAREPPHPYVLKIAKQKGFSIDELRARKVTKKDLVDFDFIIAFDQSNLQHLYGMAQREYRQKIRLLLSFVSPEFKITDVPDPYGSPISQFCKTYDIIRCGIKCFVADLRRLGAIP